MVSKFRAVESVMTPVEGWREKVDTMLLSVAAAKL